MKKIIFLAALAALTVPATAQKSKKQAKTSKTEEKAIPPISQEDVEMEHLKLQMRQLGPQHHFMMMMAGSFKEEITSWSAPGATPVVSHGVRDGRPVMENHFISFNSSIMANEGRMEAQSVLSWDVLKNLYVKIWYDNVSPGIMYMEGKPDMEKKTIEFTGMVIDPRTRKPVNVRQVVDLSNPQVQITQIYALYKGEEYKAMEIKSTRN